MKKKLRLFLLVAYCLLVSAQITAQKVKEVNKILITNVNIFDGVNDELKKEFSILIEGNKITKIAKSISAPDNVTVIDGDGRTLTPGFIDAHTHLHWNLGVFEHFYESLDYQYALNLVEAKNTLMRGFTTIRDIGGQVLGTKKAIDEGYFPGPRIYSPCAALSMTTGHGDFRSPCMAPRMMGGPSVTEAEHVGLVIFADGVPEVLTASRMQFRECMTHLILQSIH